MTRVEVEAVDTWLLVQPPHPKSHIFGKKTLFNYNDLVFFRDVITAGNSRRNLTVGGVKAISSSNLRLGLSSLFTLHPPPNVPTGANFFT